MKESSYSLDALETRSEEGKIEIILQKWNFSFGGGDWKI